MSDAPHPPLSDAVVRFRVRSLLWVTTGVAVVTAIAAPFYRRQSSVAQDSLLVCWFLMAVFASFGVWRARQNWLKKSLVDGATDFVFWPTSRWNWKLLPTNAGRLLAGALWFAFMALGTVSVAKSAEREAQHWHWWPSLIFSSCLWGLILGFGLTVAFPVPLRFSAKGICKGREWIRWEYCRSAKWARPGVIQLHRLAGDLYASVPNESRDSFESYLRGKTHFIESASA